ncbi:hypothetical protein MXB_1726, partial [Myxobolus squamalis]
RYRPEINSASPQPDTGRSIIIPERYIIDEATLNKYIGFLLPDSGIGDNERRYIFDPSSTLFFHVYATLAERNGFILPVLHALLPKKRRHAHTVVSAIRVIWPDLSPISLSIGFQ